MHSNAIVRKRDGVSERDGNKKREHLYTGIQVPVKNEKLKCEWNCGPVALTRVQSGSESKPVAHIRGVNQLIVLTNVGRTQRINVMRLNFGALNIIWKITVLKYDKKVRLSSLSSVCIALLSNGIPSLQWTTLTLAGEHNDEHSM